MHRSLTIDNISILDKLISVCCDRMDDEVINALFGFKKKKYIYQNGAENLVDSYFKIEKENEKNIKSRK